MNKQSSKKRWITGFMVSMCFNIKEDSLSQLRKSLIGSEYIYRPPNKEIKKTSNFWYDLDYLLNKFELKREIPQHLIKMSVI